MSIGSVAFLGLVPCGGCCETRYSATVFSFDGNGGLIGATAGFVAVRDGSEGGEEMYDGRPGG